ncbi:cupin domain-containing protein [Fibrella aquatilis]|uniref:Cupin domain-containing protein n=1 Tax=Fibrella aquatilis TaxID=2817059 RepID=A0A939G723_9BACT|nr:cupin domain-containing protein [Fibrella aquatilis]MBO0931829.1 cupin domain-containing protein [Fibrella aquatilis]
MAYRNKLIRNPKAGQEILFLYTAKNTNGQFLGLIITFQPQGQPPAPYYHPHQTIDLDVLCGELTVLLNGEQRQLAIGATLHIPAYQQYAFWNKSTQPVRINCRLRPALDTEYLLETMTGLAANQTGRVKGVLHLLQTALIAHAFSHVFRLPRWPFVLQKTVLTLLALLAYLAGLRPTYREYLD